MLTAHLHNKNPSNNLLYMIEEADALLKSFTPSTEVDIVEQYTNVLAEMVKSLEGVHIQIGGKRGFPASMIDVLIYNLLADRELWKKARYHFTRNQKQMKTQAIQVDPPECKEVVNLLVELLLSVVSEEKNNRKNVLLACMPLVKNDDDENHAIPTVTAAIQDTVMKWDLETETEPHRPASVNSIKLLLTGNGLDLLVRKEDQQIITLEKLYRDDPNVVVIICTNGALHDSNRKTGDVGDHCAVMFHLQRAHDLLQRAQKRSQEDATEDPKEIKRIEEAYDDIKVQLVASFKRGPPGLSKNSIFL
jgi:hypothetical protein